MRQGLSRTGAIGAELIQTYVLPYWLEAVWESGAGREGCACLAEALARGTKLGNVFVKQIYRLKGS